MDLWLQDLLEKVSPQKRETVSVSSEQNEAASHVSNSISRDSRSLEEHLQTLTSKFAEHAEAFQKDIHALTGGVRGPDTHRRPRLDDGDEVNFPDFMCKGPGAPPTFPAPVLPPVVDSNSCAAAAPRTSKRLPRTVLSRLVNDVVCDIVNHVDEFVAARRSQEEMDPSEALIVSNLSSGALCGHEYKPQVWIAMLVSSVVEEIVADIERAFTDRGRHIMVRQSSASVPREALGEPPGVLRDDFAGMLQQVTECVTEKNSFQKRPAVARNAIYNAVKAVRRNSLWSCLVLILVGNFVSP
jgi:hypothetical protein